MPLKGERLKDSVRNPTMNIIVLVSRPGDGFNIINEVFTSTLTPRRYTMACWNEPNAYAAMCDSLDYFQC
ncbi:hypothetical protein BofuT4_uP080340.1 [Botrytis cinerea T4]|uniref:Uncharacterized protein n=1 Tax=Botryotinia fuckeliana (strain T4) TaxID=999810 RepID=G2YKU1_BOTF4|nr:hypothetical protein BofuT4_uP080340.1 [Botrytis cinerea T4]